MKQFNFNPNSYFIVKNFLIILITILLFIDILCHNIFCMIGNNLFAHLFVCLLFLIAIVTFFTCEHFQWQRLAEANNTSKALDIIKREEALKENNRRAMLHIMRDLTGSMEEIKKLSQVKSDFISTVSHELRTPLAIVQESISQLVEGLRGPITDEQEQLLKVSLCNVEWLGSLIENLLNISKIEAGKLELKRIEFNVVDLISEIVSAYALMVKKKGLEIINKCPKEAAMVYADKDLIAEVLRNLLSNALNYTEKGYVEIGFVLKENKVEIYVKDTGFGISPIDQAKLFNKFIQIGRIHGPGSKGTGLGLSISKGYLEAHGEKIWIESSIPGQGTKIVFSLPRRKTNEI
ncbi:MAG: HAMP domain-containing sensor histidine kinase [Candidatus Margulisiibacteriota bacterium]